MDPRYAEILLLRLKLNERYRELFDKHRASLEAWHRFLGEYDTLRESDLEQAKAWRREHLPEVEKARHPEPFWPLVNREHLGIEGFARAPFSVLGDDGKRVLNAEEALAFIDPKKKIDTIDKARRDLVLSQIFRCPGITILPLEEKYEPSCNRVRLSLWATPPQNTAPLIAALGELQEKVFPVPEQKDESLPHPLDEESNPLHQVWEAVRIAEEPAPPPADPQKYGIQSYERVLVIDLRKKRDELKKEFSKILEREGEDPYKRDRDRDIALQRRQLEVFRLHHFDGEPLVEIARRIEKPVSTIQDWYYRAYELTQGTEYPQKRTADPFRETYQRELTIGSQPEMSREQELEAIKNHFLGGPEEEPE